MATLDPTTQTITLRIVFDGLGMAGKTTNLRQIYEILSSSRRGDLYIPEERRGRTLYFDWLEIEAGFIDEHRLRCQLLTVPGQFSYAQRRWHLLSHPDAVVAVVDSTPQGIVRARYALNFLRDTIEKHSPPIPLLVQANKQDIEGALRGPEVLNELQIPGKVRVIEASALQGDGVRATLVFALQAARERLARTLHEGGFEALRVGTETAEEVYHQLLKQESDNVEMHEGEIIADRVLARLAGAPAPSAQHAATSQPPEAPHEPAASAPPATLPSAAPAAAAPSAAETQASAERPASAPREAPAPRPAPQEDPASAANEDPALPAEASALPSLPPLWGSPWLVWPAAGGRAYLQEAREDGELRFLGERPADQGGEREFGTDRWSLSVVPGELFRDRRHGALALRELAEAHVAVADLVPSPLCLVLQPTPEGGGQLWRVRRRLSPHFSGPQGASRDDLRRLAAYVARVAALAARHGVLLTLDPKQIAHQEHTSSVGVGLASLERPAPITRWGAGWLRPLISWAASSEDFNIARKLFDDIARLTREATTSEEQKRLDWLENWRVAAQDCGAFELVAPFF